uniref:RNA-dependent RNA polymerase n=1 Tax=Strongyloides papillosus TaxID=174720 RepID=A0A0N5BZA5_STREA
FKLGRNGAEAYQNIVDAWGKGQLPNAQYVGGLGNSKEEILISMMRRIRCHFSKLVLKKLGELKCGALSHSLYSPDLFLTISDLFEHLDIFFKDKLFKNQDSAEGAFTDFIRSKKPEFYKTGIQKLVER